MSMGFLRPGAHFDNFFRQDRLGVSIDGKAPGSAENNKCLVVSNIFYVAFHIWDNASH